MTISALMLAFLMTVSSTASTTRAPAIDDIAGTQSTGCSHWTSRTTPPASIRVFRIHHKGSRTPARVDVVPFRTYVGRVMASGAWPSRLPRESLRVGAVAIKQYAWWYVLNHQSGYRFHGVCYDIRDGDQYYKSNVKVSSRIRAAVADTWGVSLRKGGRFFRSGWSGGGGGCGSLYDGWHLPENGVSACAKRGWAWKRILQRYLDPRLRFVETPSA